MMACQSDELFIDCHYECGFRITSTVPHNVTLPPSVVERWHLRMAKHVRREHMGVKR